LGGPPVHRPALLQVTIPPEDTRVSTLELFFDLVFVFTITQLTTVLVENPTARGVLRVVLTLAIVWWMYAGYLWLTNHVAMDGSRRRTALLGGMAAFFVTALAIPQAFGDSGVWFGVAYLVVVVVHVVLFQQASGAAPAAMLQIFRFNLAAALLVLVGGIAGGVVEEVLWAGAVFVTWGLSRLVNVSAFDLTPSHFVERHSLVVLIALGESVVAVGATAGAHHLDGALIAAALLGLALSTLLWWAYFGGDDDRALEAMIAEHDLNRRARLALAGFGLCFIPLLLGIVLLAAGERESIGRAFHTLDTAPALFLAFGAALFLSAEALFRRVLAIAPSSIRLLAAALCLLTIVLGVQVAAAAQLAGLVAVIGATFALEGAGGPGSTEAPTPAPEPRPASRPAPRR
jgi:low temperature requirement protein LtrA